MVESDPQALKQAIEWIEAFPESDHGIVWLKAFEAGYHEPLLGQLISASKQERTEKPTTLPLRPYSQSVYCIDFRS